MLSLVNGLDSSNVKKIRRNLILLSIICIILANLEFVSNVINVFGLEIRVDRDHAVKVIGRALSLVFVVYALRAMPSYLATLVEIESRRLEAKKRRGYYDVSEGYGLNDPVESDGSPDAAYASVDALFKHKFDELKRRHDRLSFFLSIIIVSIADFGVPTVLALIAVLDPSLSFII
ncbi:hypothetical protein [Pararhodobacter oceanensis]|uniref:hypothetical protein n=1 Tax=Pararhodobacter oceanensis TaxID=2172121 RepID=UPI003A8DE613